MNKLDLVEYLKSKTYDLSKTKVCLAAINDIRLPYNTFGVLQFNIPLYYVRDVGVLCIECEQYTNYEDKVVQRHYLTVLDKVKRNSPAVIVATLY